MLLLLLKLVYFVDIQLFEPRQLERDVLFVLLRFSFT